MPILGPGFKVRATLRGKQPGSMISPEASDPLEIYQLQEKVGYGTYGDIYRAIIKGKPSEYCALKIIDLEKTEDDIEDLLFEVDFQAKCSSPYLAKYIGAWLWDNKLTIAMEFLGGGTLETLIQRNKLSEQMCAYILREILRGLYYMHKSHKIHRDIKPANVLFDDTTKLKLGIQN